MLGSRQLQNDYGAAICLRLLASLRVCSVVLRMSEVYVVVIGLLEKSV